MSEHRSFFSELKRRNVYKVAVAYAVVSWLLIQAASILFPTFDAPAWVMKVFVTLLSFGFPAALIFSWAFEITPEGIKREKEVATHESITHHTGRKIVGITVVLAAIAAALLAFQLLRPKTSAVRESEVSAKRNAGDITEARPIPEKSIAVLPFDNLSDDKSNAYFAEGIQDEILTRLSKIAALKVISRTSTQKYKSAPDNLRDVGRQLGVANLLEGSVQKVANAVHVNVQLIRAANDEHVWAESYNRKLDDVFGVEGEVASAIADQLNAKLTGAEAKAITDKSTQNPAAYDAYLHGLAIERNGTTDSSFQEAAGAYATAVQADPNFALAWARLAATRSYLHFNGIEPNANSAAAVKEAADRAMALQPELAEAWIAKGSYLYRVKKDYAGGLQAFKEGQKRLPNSSFALEYMAFVERRLGLWKEAEAHFKQAAELDPRDFHIFMNFGSDFLNYLRRFDEAQAALDRALEISPGNPEALVGKASLFQSEGRLEEAAKQLALIPANSTEDNRVTFARVAQAEYERHFDAAIALLEPKAAIKPEDPSFKWTNISFLIQLGYCQEWAGRRAEARATFARIIQAIKSLPDPALLSHFRTVFLAAAYAGSGDKTNALDQAQAEIANPTNDALFKASAEVLVAQIQARFGDMDSAIAAIPHLLEVPAGITRSDLRFDPFWDPLRNDSRFQKLCQAQTN